MAPRPSRPYPTHTKLGRLLHERGHRALHVTTIAGVYPRTVTEYLAGRQQPSPQKLVALTQWLKVPGSAILEDKYPWLPEDQAAKEQRAKAQQEQVA